MGGHVILGRWGITELTSSFTLQVSLVYLSFLSSLSTLQSHMSFQSSGFMNELIYKVVNFVIEITYLAGPNLPFPHAKSYSVP